jgi:hypothetical protein
MARVVGWVDVFVLLWRMGFGMEHPTPMQLLVRDRRCISSSSFHSSPFYQQQYSSNPVVRSPPTTHLLRHCRVVTWKKTNLLRTERTPVSLVRAAHAL